MFFPILLLFALLFFDSPSKPNDKCSEMTKHRVSRPHQNAIRRFVGILTCDRRGQSRPRENNHSFRISNKAIRSGTVHPGAICLICGLPQDQGEHHHG